MIVIDARCACTTWPVQPNGHIGRCGRCGERPRPIVPTNVYDTEDPRRSSDRPEEEAMAGQVMVRIGQRVTLARGAALVMGTVTALRPDGTVRVRCDDGETRDLTRGEIL